MLHLNFPAASLVDFWKEPEAEESAEEQRLTQEVPWVESTTWMMVGIAEHLLGTWKHIYCKWNTCSKRISSMTQRTCHNFIRFYIRKHVYIDFCNCFLKYGASSALPLFDHHFMQLHSPFYPLANKHQRSTSTHCSNFIETPRWMVCWKLGKP